MDKSNGVGWVCINRPGIKMASESGSGIFGSMLLVGFRT